MGAAVLAALDGNASQANKRTDLSNNRGAKQPTVAYQYGLTIALQDHTGLLTETVRATTLTNQNVIRTLHDQKSG